MSKAISLLKTLAIPALISLAIYLFLSYILVPTFRHYQQRYAQYLPLQHISTQTSSVRERMADALMHFFLPGGSPFRRQPTSSSEDNNPAQPPTSSRFGRLFSTLRWWRRRRQRGGRDGPTSDNDDEDGSGDDGFSVFDDEEDGETMVGMNIDPVRRAALEQRRSFVGDFQHDDGDSRQVRLSRELEEGFMDDSGSDQEEDGDRYRRRL